MAGRGGVDIKVVDGCVADVGVVAGAAVVLESSNGPTKGNVRPNG